MTEVNLYAYTRGAESLEDSLTDLIAYCARVSNPANQNNKITAPRLLKYLARENHWSPFEMVSVTMEITTTRDIARQILRHRSFSFQEFSQRYAIPEFNWEFKEARLQDNKNRQNSIEILDPEIQRQWEYYQREVAKTAERAYNWGQRHGFAKEVCRVVLPEGLTPSTMYMAGTIRSWLHYIELRSGHGTQKEHQEVAVLCAAELEKVFTKLWKTDFFMMAHRKSI